MDNKQALENSKYLNSLFESLNFDEETKTEHFGKIMTIIFASASEKLDKMNMSEKAELPEMNSLEDFYGYYGQYIDKDLINKIIEEETEKAFNGYFSAINDKLENK